MRSTSLSTSTSRSSSPYPRPSTTFVPFSITVLTAASMTGPTRTPKPGDRPPRPPNAWILYRSDMLKNLPPVEPGQPKRPQADVSKAIAVMWKDETEEIRAEYERRAERAKEEHALKYPGYRFAPMKKSDKERLRAEKLREKADAKRARQKSTPADTPPSASAAHIHSLLLHASHQASDGDASPPMSSASSPAPPTPDSFRSSSLQLRDFSQPHACPSPQPAPVASSSSLMLPTAPSQPQAGVSHPLSRPNTVPPPPAYFEQAPMPGPSSLLGWPTAAQDTRSHVPGAQDASWQPTQLTEPSMSQQLAQDNVHFQLPVLNGQTLPPLDEGFLPEDFAALLAGTTDPTVYTIDGVDAGLTALPPGSLDLSMDNFGDPLSGGSEQFRDLLETFNYDAYNVALDANSHGAQMAGPVLSGAQPIQDNWFYGDFEAPQIGDAPPTAPASESMLEYFNFDVLGAPPPAEAQEAQSRATSFGSATGHQAAHGQHHGQRISSTATIVSEASDVDDAHAQQPQPTVYRPPAGAANAGTRRVAGSWRPPYPTPDSPGANDGWVAS
ncbi:hypothetical protein FA95DRAFT_1561627 [Auriscalpium vulgare]|uniref:Uncharacterized protein n=1 Tax=Auriscalpium vulgare TaxID=40419 RepID=A0ACB8RLE1_9AGAM|nr:hypothetical protein FA95DRAFT_1561627 [Auriscalpium vulgare]